MNETARGWVIKKDQKENLDRARDQLLIKIAETICHLTFDCAPTGKNTLVFELQRPLYEFKVAIRESK